MLVVGITFSAELDHDGVEEARKPNSFAAKSFPSETGSPC